MKLKDVLRGVLSPEELQQLVRGYDVIGDIAVTIIPAQLEEKQHLVGQAVMELNRHIRVVAKRAGNYAGEFRTIPLQVIAGENRLTTRCSESGVRLDLDLERVYFSVRSGSERLRLAALVKPGEKILVMFSGIGVYPLVISGNSKAAQLVGVEKNPAAHFYAQQNLALNRNIHNVSLLEGDAGLVVPTLKEQFDRVIMPLPGSGDRFLPAAFSVLKRGGWLHYYAFQQAGQFARSVQALEDACRRAGRRMHEPVVTPCGHPSPGKFRICVDARVGGLLSMFARPSQDQR